MLIRLLYSSISIHDRGHTTDLDILRKAQTFNERAGITGFLFRSRQGFIQVLEGEQTVVDALIARVKSDTRHKGYRMHLYEEIDRRNFDSWGMGYCDIAEDRASELSRLLSANTDAGQAAIVELEQISREYV